MQEATELVFRLLVSALFVVPMALAPVAHGHDDRDKEDLLRALEDTRAAYEARLEQLEARLVALEGPPPVAQGNRSSDSSGFEAPSLTLRGFGHAQHDTARDHPRDGTPRARENHFTMGGLDLFITSEISENVSFLNETIFDYNDDGSIHVNVDRIALRFHVADWLNLKLGREHTAIGDWNQNFNHGVYLQTTAEPPLLFAFKDREGILPLHYVGLELSGRLYRDAGTFAYTLNVANGRGPFPDTVQAVTDADDTKMAALRLSYESHGGLGLGINALYDVIPADPDLSALRARRMKEFIYGAYTYYRVDPFDVTLEAQFLHHADDTSGSEFRHYGAYAQLAYGIGRWKPYYRLDLLRIEGGDPYFLDYEDPLAPIQLDDIEDVLHHTLGLRWEARPFLAVTSEFRYGRFASKRGVEGAVQVSFAF